MKRKEAIDKIKNLWSKDAVHVGTKAQAYQILDMMWKISGRGTKKYIDSFIDQRHNYKSSTCYSYDQDDKYCDTDTWVSYGNIKHYKKAWYTIYEASDFLGWEEKEEKLAEEINEWLERVYWVSAKNAHVETNLHSTVNQMWDKVDQEIHFVCWSVRTIENIDTSLIEQSMFTTLVTDKLPRDINTENVAYIRIKSKGNNTRPWTPQPLIFHLKNDYKVTIKDIIPSTIKIGEMIKYRCSNGDMILIARKHLNATEGNK